jgi:hypothetical protein
MRAMRVALRVAIVVTVLAVLGVGIAYAATFGGKNVRASFNGWITPHALPRSGPAPIALHMKGTVVTLKGEPPQLRRVTIEINRNGKLLTAGLPVCRRRRIKAATTAQALTACRGALVGSGRFAAHIAIPSQAPFPARGRLLAFNAIQHGRHVILAHIYGTVPVPTSQVLVLTVRRSRHGTFGTSISVKLPELAKHWGYVTGFRLTLHRLYTYKGTSRSFISASCPAPAGITAALFVAAKGTYYLAGGRRLTRVLDGSCKVRG